MKSPATVTLALTAWMCVLAGNTLATQTPLMFRNESPQLIHGGYTDHILDTNWGSTVLTLPFTGTTTYDFYSPRLVSPGSIAATGNGGGAICMNNTSLGASNSVTVTGEMKYFDYDPSTGAQTLIIDTGASDTKNVNNGQTATWATPTPAMPGAYTIPVGHMIHIALTIVLVSGNPGKYVGVVYNAPVNGKFTEGQLSENSSGSINTGWAFDSAPLPAPLSIFPQSNGQMLLTGYGTALATYSVQATTNLAGGNWVTLTTTNSDDGGLFSFMDQDATNHPCRFYRSVTH